MTTSSVSSSSSLSAKPWRDVVLLVLALTCWFGYELGTRSLWHPDEGRYAEIAREMVATGDYLTPRLNGIKYFEKPPLVYWLEAGTIRLFGVNEWAVRIWPALFALLGCVAIFLLGRQLAGRRAGFLAAGVLATSPFYDIMGGALSLDMPLAGLLTMALAAFLSATHLPVGLSRRLMFYFFYICCALAVLTKGLIGMVIPGMVIAVWIVLLGQWRLLGSMYLLTGIPLFLAVAVPWHVLVGRANPEFTQFYFIHEHFQRYLSTVHHRYQPAWYFIPVLLAGFYPWVTFLPLSVRDGLPTLWRQRREHADTWFLLLWAVLPFLFFSFSDSKLAPYVLPIFPPLALLLGRWFAHVWDDSRPVGRKIFVFLLVLDLLFTAVLLVLPHLAATYPRIGRATDHLGYTLYVMAAGVFLAGLLPFLGWRRGNRTVLTLFLAGAAVLVLVFDLNLPRFDAERSVKPLALMLKPHLKPNDEVATYRRYFQDLPVYLERRVTIVDWKGELAFGMSVEDTRAWVIDEATFARRLLSGSVYILMDRDDYGRLRKLTIAPLYVLGEYGHSVLLSNKESHL